MIDLAPSPFALAAAELRRLGVDLARFPGEYRVNFHNGSDATAQTAETVDAARDLGQAMAAERAEAQSHSGGPRRRRRRRMTPKAHNRRLRLAQMRRLRASAIRQQRRFWRDRPRTNDRLTPSSTLELPPAASNQWGAYGSPRLKAFNPSKKQTAFRPASTPLLFVTTRARG
jgi:hypothetical protein